MVRVKESLSESESETDRHTDRHIRTILHFLEDFDDFSFSEGEFVFLLGRVVALDGESRQRRIVRQPSCLRLQGHAPSSGKEERKKRLRRRKRRRKRKRKKKEEVDAPPIRKKGRKFHFPSFLSFSLPSFSFSFSFWAVRLIKQ